MNKYGLMLLVGVCFISLLGCQSVSEPLAVRYCSSFPLDTTVCVTEIPFEENKASHAVVQMGDKVMSHGDYGMVSIYRYPGLHFLYKRSMECDLSFVENGHYCSVKNGVADVFEWKGDSLEQTSSFVLCKWLPCATIESIGDGNYIYVDNYECKGLNEFHLLNSRTQQQKSKGEYPESPNRFKRLKDFKIAYAHSLRTKPDKSRFVLYYCLNRRFRIYERNGTLLHEVFLDYPPANDKVVDLSYERQYIHFSGAYTTEKHIYLLSPDTRGLSKAKPECSILVIDWEGNLVARYRLNTYLYSFFIDEDSKKCIGVGCQKGGVYSFFSFKLLN